MKQNSDADPIPLSAEQVAKRFSQGAGQVEAIHDVSLTVRAGEFVAVMGASGSGKSTLLHVLAGLTQPSAGRVRVDGRDLASMSDRELTLFRRRRVGLVFQAFNLIPTLTAEDNIRLPLLTGGSRGRNDEQLDQLDELLARLRLDHRRSHRPDALSGGEQQRVAIARALIADPSIVLADEPTGSLDSVTGQEICELLLELNQQQRRAIVVVTHEPAVAVWARRVVVLKDGRRLTEFDTNDFPDALSLAAHYQDLVNAPDLNEADA